MINDDQRLIVASTQGDTAAFGELVRRYQDRLYNTVYRLIGNSEDAYDVLQEIFLNAYQSLPGFKGNSRFFTWLYRIAINSAISFKRKNRPVLSLQGDRNDRLIGEPVDASAFGRPGYALEQAEEERRIQNALKALSAEHRTVLVLKDMDGQKYESIAEILEVPIGTVRSRLHRARLELRELLDPEG